MSRDLDAKIAQEIMGVVPELDDGVIYYEGHCDPKPYSKDIKLAFNVVDKMTRKNGEIIGQFQLTRFSLYTAYFSYEKPDGGQFDFEASAPTPEEAICLAALIVMWKD